MWYFYKKTFAAVQLATGIVSWMVYRNTNHEWIPALVFFASMEISAVFGAMWANRLHKKMQSHTSCVLN